MSHPATLPTTRWQSFLGWLSLGVSSQTTMPILSTVLLRVEPEASGGPVLVGCTTNLDIHVTATVPLAEARPEAAAGCVPFRILQTLASQLRLAEVELSFDRSDLTLRCGGGVYKLRLLPEAKFPPRPQSHGLLQLSPLAQSLEPALRAAAARASQDNGRPALENVLLQAHPEHVQVCASDGRRLVDIRQRRPERGHTSPPCHIPARLLKAVLRGKTQGLWSIPNGDDPEQSSPYVLYEPEEGVQIHIRHDRENSMPKLDAILRQVNWDRGRPFSHAEWLSALCAIRPLIEGDSARLTSDVATATLATVGLSEADSARVNLESAGLPTGIDLTFNPAYVTAALTTLEEFDCAGRFFYEDGKSPFAFADPEQQYREIIMPKLNNT